MPRYVPDFAERPGKVTAVRGVIFQSDGRSAIGSMFIRPVEALDRWIAGIPPRPGAPSLAMHAGLHVVIDGKSEYVAEQLVGSLHLDFKNGLNWTPIQNFRQRDRGGWDATVGLPNFRAIEPPVVDEVAQRLNTIQGHPFAGEDCTAFIERACRNRRLFADSPLLQLVGIGARIGDPALPLLKPDAELDPRTSSALQFDRIRNLPDAIASPTSPNVRVLIARLLLGSMLGAGLAWIAASYSSSSRKSTPISSTARKFLR